MTVLIAGATGQIAAPVLRKLSAIGVPTISLVRDRERAAKILGSSTTELIELTDEPGEIGHAFARADSVLLSMGLLSPQERDFQHQVIDLAARYSVKHVVRIAVLGTSKASLGLVQQLHAEIDDHLTGSGVPYSCLRPALFQSTLLSYAPEVREHDAWMGSAPTARYPFIHPQDVSDAALAVLLSADPQSRIYDLTGPGLLRYSDVADLLSRELGRPIRYSAVSHAKYRTVLEERGLPPQFVELLVSRDLSGEAGESDKLTDAVRELTGRQARPLAGFLHQVRDQFSSARTDAASALPH